MVREDAFRPPPDAAVLNEAGVCRTGSVSGLACAPTGDLPIAHAVISAATRDCGGQARIVETESDARGNFRLTGLAPGVTEVTLTAGNFVGRFAVEVLGGADVFLSGGLSNKVCLRADAARLAVLTGNFDRMQDRLDDLGFSYDLYCGGSSGHREARRMLADWDRLRRYQILFVNCASGIDLRATNREVQVIVENLRRFVAEGGSMYVSDLAADFVERLWPGQVDFEMTVPGEGRADACCVCTECPDGCVDREAGPTLNCPEGDDLPQACRRTSGVIGRGAPGEIPSRIVSPFLQSYLDDEALDVVLDLGGWVSVLAVDRSVEVLVEGEADGRPLMVLLQPVEGGGRVAYTSFHNHRQATEAMKQILRALVFRL